MTVRQLISYFGVGDVTCQIVVQHIKQIFFGEAYRNPFCLCVCWVFCLFV